MRSRLRRSLADVYDVFEKKYRAYEYLGKARKRLKRVNGGADCRAEYEKTVIPYWKKYSVKPKLLWYRLYAENSGVVDPRYIPDDIWFEYVLPYYSNQRFRRFGEDKCLHGIWFPDVKRPVTVAAQIAGVYYDADYNIITKEEAAERCASYGRFLIKPSVDTGEGVRIRFYDGLTVTPEDMLREFDAFGCNFIAQEIIKQHPALSALNPTSLNTIRIISFLFENEVHILSSILRVGGDGSRVDNVGAGGYACAVMEDGRLGTTAINRRSERCETNAGGVRFDSVVIPAYKDALDMVKRLHTKLAHFKIIGWDIGINESAEPVMIEFNTAPGQNQFCCGPTFGELTEKVLRDVFIDKTLQNSKN